MSNSAAFCPVYRFLRRQVSLSGIPHLLENFPVSCATHLKGFSIVSEAEVDVLLEFSYFFYDPKYVGNFKIKMIFYCEPLMIKHIWEKKYCDMWL